MRKRQKREKNGKRLEQVCAICTKIKNFEIALQKNPYYPINIVKSNEASDFHRAESPEGFNKDHGKEES